MAKKPAVEIIPNAEQNAAITHWLEMKRQALHSKEAEMEARKAVVAMFWPSGADEGTTRVTFGKGYGLKYTNKLNYKLESVDATDDALEEIRALGNEGTFVADRLVKFKPELSLTEYRLLTHPENAPARGEDIKKIIDKALVITPASPELELIEPK